MQTNNAALEELRGNIRDVLKKECPIDLVQAHLKSENSYDAALWRKIAELGWLSLAIDENDDGLGLGIDALAVLYLELGRCAAPVPVLGTLLAADAISGLGDEAQRQHWLPLLISGEVRAAVSDPAQAPVAIVACNAGSVEVSGRWAFVLDGPAADVFLLLVEVNGRSGFLAVKRDEVGLKIENFPITDLTRGLAHISIERQIFLKEQVLVAGDFQQAKRQLLLHAAIAVAADAIGGTEAVFESTVEYLKIREQFGKPIGSFQALKHRAADHKAALVGATALYKDVVSRAALGQATQPEVLEAKALAVSTYSQVSRDCIQLHGGVGFTWDLQPHIFVKRALLNAVLFGTIAQNLDESVRGLAA
jgi:alkylation response protein AidB-like acyl-CoA dehydrogenase